MGTAPSNTIRQTPAILPVPERTDEQLVKDYREGDNAAFRMLIDRHQDALFRFLIRFMGDRQAAEDVFQDAFLQIHLAADSFDVERRFKPWLFTIAANKGRDYLRRNHRRPELDLSAPVEGGGGDGEGGARTYLEMMEIDVDPPSLSLDRAERDALVQRAVDALPEHLREILLLAYFQRLSYANIAEGLGIPLGTVKSRLHAAVAAFARQWAEVTGQAQDREDAPGVPAADPPAAGHPARSKKRPAPANPAEPRAVPPAGV